MQVNLPNLEDDRKCVNNNICVILSPPRMAECFKNIRHSDPALTAIRITDDQSVLISYAMKVQLYKNQFRKCPYLLYFISNIYITLYT